MANFYRSLVIRVVLAFVVVSLILQIVGFVTPGWQVTKVDSLGIDVESNIGLWYHRFCVADDCNTYTLKEFDNLVFTIARGVTYTSDGLQDQYLEADIETTIALFFCFVALVTSAVWLLLRRRNNKIPAIMCTIACMISGVLCLVAAGRYGDSQRQMYQGSHYYKDILGYSPLKAPYSLILTGVGGIIILIVSFLCLVGMCMFDSEPRRQPKYYPPAQEMRQDYNPPENLRPYQHESVRQYHPEPVRPHYPEPVRYSVRETPIVEPLRHTRNSYRQSGGDVVYVKYDPPRGGSHLSSSKYRHY